MYLRITVNHFTKIFVHCDDNTVLINCYLQDGIVRHFGIYRTNRFYIMVASQEPLLYFSTHTCINKEF